MPKLDPVSHLQSVKLALAAELMQPNPCEAVILTCGMFLADAEREAGEYQTFLNMRQRLDPHE